MVPCKKIKTYEKKLKSTVSLTINKKRFKRLKPRELPPPTTNDKSLYFHEDSLNIETEDTFDKLLKGKIYNEVQIVNTFINYPTTSDSESYKNSIKNRYHTGDNTPKIITNSTEESIVKIQSNRENQPVKFANKQTSLDKPVDISLSIEKEQRNQVTFSSLSYIKVPKLEKLIKPAIVSSTPYVPDDTKSLPNTVSPIQPISDHCDQQQQHDDVNISNNVTPKLRRSNRKRATKLEYAQRRVLLRDLNGSFSNNESQKYIEKTKQHSDFIQNLNNCKNEINKSDSKDNQLEIMQPIVILSRCVFNQTVNDSNQFCDNTNSKTEQMTRNYSQIISESISPLFLTYSICDNDNNSDSKHLKSSISCNNRQDNAAINQQSDIKNSIVNKNDNLDSSNIIESSIIEDCNDQLASLKNITKRKRNDIKPGKQYRRSLSLLQQSFRDDSIGQQQLKQRRRSTLRNSQIVPLETTNSCYATVL